MDIQNNFDRLLPVHIFTLITGTFCTLWFYQADVDNQLRKNRSQHNALIEAEYRAAGEKLHATVLKTVQNDHKVDRTSNAGKTLEPAAQRLAGA